MSIPLLLCKVLYVLTLATATSPAPLLTVREVAARLGVGEALTRRLMRRRERPLPTVRIGRLIRVPSDALQSWLLAELHDADRVTPTVTVSLLAERQGAERISHRDRK